MAKFSSVFESPLRVKSAGWGEGHSPEQFWHRAEPPYVNVTRFSPSIVM